MNGAKAESQNVKLSSGSGGRIVCIGECMIEFTEQSDGSYRLYYAGDTFNTAWYCRAALPQEWAVDYCSAVGDEFHSQRMLDFISSQGIGIEDVERIPKTSVGLYLVRQENGDRRFSYWRENSAARRLAESRSRLDAALSGASLIYFSGITLAIIGPNGRRNLLEAIEAARKAGTLVAFDPNERPALWRDADEMKASIEAAAGHCDWVFPTFPDEAALFGDASLETVADRYLRLGAGEVVVKNGAESALIARGNERLDVPAVKVPSVLDATGAGDSFNAGYITSRLKGCDPLTAAQRAHALASRVVGIPGAIPASGQALQIL